MALAYGMGAAVAVGSIMSKWFIHHRAKAISLSSTGVSLGGATLVPLGTWLIGEGGLRLGAPVLGATVVIVALPVLWLAIVPDPEGIVTGGHDNKAARTVAVRQNETINTRALGDIFRQIIANNRAGGWRKIKQEK